MSAVRKFLWDWREQPPMTDIAAAVAELTGGAVTMTMPDTGSDSYELVISRSPVSAGQQAAYDEDREADEIARDDGRCLDCGMRHKYADDEL